LFESIRIEKVLFASLIDLNHNPTAINPHKKLTPILCLQHLLLHLTQRIQPIRVQLINRHYEPLLGLHAQFPEFVHYYFLFFAGGGEDELAPELVRQDWRGVGFEDLQVYQFDLAGFGFYVLVALSVYEYFL
jgi:hypothetical protein